MAKEFELREYEKDLLISKLPREISDTIWLDAGWLDAYDHYLDIMQEDGVDEVPAEQPLPELEAGQQADLDLQIRAFENGLNPLQQHFWERAQQQRAEMQGNGYPDYVNKMCGVAKFMGRVARDALTRGSEIVEALGDLSGSAQFERSMNEQA